MYCPHGACLLSQECMNDNCWLGLLCMFNIWNGNFYIQCLIRYIAYFEYRIFNKFCRRKSKNQFYIGSSFIFMFQCISDNLKHRGSRYCPFKNSLYLPNIRHMSYLGSLMYCLRMKDISLVKVQYTFGKFRNNLGTNLLYR